MPKVGNIGISAFENCTALKNIPSFTFTYPNAFKGCTSLTTLNFPTERLNTIGENAFENCTGLTEVIIEKTNPYTIISEKAFKGCTNLKKVQITGDFRLRSNAFENCSKLTQVICDELTAIGNSAFRNCTSLTNVNFPSVTQIEYASFHTCTELITVNMPLCNNLGLNGAMDCFRKCSKLEYVNMPNIPYVGVGMFIDCSSLPTLTFKAVSEIRSDSFENCTSLTDIYLGYEGLITLQNVSAFGGVTKGLKVHVRSEYADQYATAGNWSSLINNGTVVIVGDYTD